LYKHLVEEARLATSVSAGSWFLRDAGLLLIQATPRAPHTSEEVEAAIEEEIARLKSELASPWELLKVRNQIDVEAVGYFNSNAGLASHLGNAWALSGDWRTLFSDQEKLKAVSAEEVRRAAQRYMVPRRRTVASLVRGEAPTRGTAAPSRPPATQQPWELQ
jgi:predicted Zn-dependent peptidase